MKKALLIACVLSLVVSPVSFAAPPIPHPTVLHSTGAISDGSIMSQPLPAGKMCLSGNIEYYSPTELVDSSSGDPEWASLSDMSIDSISSMVIPIRFGYGITDNLSVRATLPYVSLSLKGDIGDVSGSGIGDARLEGVYQFMNETDNMPSLAGNLSIKLATGKYKDLKDDEIAIGTGGTDVIASVFASKKMGPVVGKAMLGYEVTGKMTDFSDSLWEFDPSDPVLLSLSCLYPVSADLEIGGELWGSFLGPDIATLGSDSNVVENSNGTVMWLSPWVSYKVSPAVSVKGVIDYPISVQATNSFVNGGENQTKGLNLNVGVSWTI